MRGLNKVMLIGRLGRDPESNAVTSGDMVCKFSVATDESWTDKSGNKQTKTEWHNIVAWRKLAEICARYLKKGSLVYLEGKLQSRKYEDRSGNDRYITEVVIHDMQMLDTRNSEKPVDTGYQNTTDDGDPTVDQPVTDDDVPF